jgi:anaerobic selenocysteine-containing dehydrogenase
MSQDDIVGVGDYEGAAAGGGALKAVADAVRGQMAIVKETRGLLNMNQPHGFDCPGCAWPDPKHTSSFEFCENGAKAVAWEATAKRTPPNSSPRIQSANSGIGQTSTSRMRAASRIRWSTITQLTEYLPISWNTALAKIGREELPLLRLLVAAHIR